MSEEIEFYAPWRTVKRLKMGPVADMAYVVYDDNSNPMAYAEDEYFLAEAIKRINMHDELVATCEAGLEMCRQFAARLADIGAYGLPEDLNGHYNGTGVDGRNVQTFQRLLSIIKAAGEYVQAPTENARACLDLTPARVGEGG